MGLQQVVDIKTFAALLIDIILKEYYSLVNVD